MPQYARSSSYTMYSSMCPSQSTHHSADDIILHWARIHGSSTNDGTGKVLVLHKEVPCQSKDHQTSPQCRRPVHSDWCNRDSNWKERENPSNCQPAQREDIDRKTVTTEVERPEIHWLMSCSFPSEQGDRDGVRSEEAGHGQRHNCVLYLRQSACPASRNAVKKNLQKPHSNRC
jgi:hypothetical protein